MCVKMCFTSTDTSSREAKDGTLDPALLNPDNLAVLYYFGDLQYWKLPGIAVKALELGYDGIGLRRLAELRNPISSHDLRFEDVRPEDVDCAFREMGVSAPIAKDTARLILATESVKRAINGESNIFDEAAHIRIHLCELKDPAPELHRIITLSQQARHAPELKWDELGRELESAMSDFLRSRE